MLGKEDDSAGEEGSSSSAHVFQGPSEAVGGRKQYWRSASWSSSRTSLPPLNPASCRDGSELTGIANGNNNAGHGQRATGPLAFRSQNSFKARSCLPPLQPLSIARRSLDEWPRAGSDDVGEWPLPSTPRGKDNDGGERLKLDLSNIQRKPNQNGGIARREKIASFDKECSKVAEHVYLGGDSVARDRDILKQHKITHILNCVGFVCPEYFKDDFGYRTLWLQDSPSEDITSILYDVFDYFEDVRGLGGRVFVHCCQGVSRSTSLVIAYLMWREGQSFDDAFQYVKAARGIADPNMGFACQLLQCQKRVHAFPLSPSSLLRMYRISPHSPYDPLHLVPKILNDPSPLALDSRGAFIIHIPSAIYVWIGKKCELIMERDARGAVCQIVRYEKVQGPIAMIKEGEEPSYFWDAFSSFLPLMSSQSSCGIDSKDSQNESCPGDRKVDLYDVDFEIFQKAIKGGFVPPLATAVSEHETHVPARESSWNGLRRKFVSGSMKEFVLAKNSCPSIVYPDSLVIDERQSVTKNMRSLSNFPLSAVSSLSSSNSSSSSSSSSSSPPYLSPDSISSDASFTSASVGDSPDASPSAAASQSDLTSSTLSNFSSMTLQSSKPSPSITQSSRFIDVNFDSKSCLRSAQRGNLSKSRKLPMLDENSLGENPMSSFVINDQDLISRSDSNCTVGNCRDADGLSLSTVREPDHQDMEMKTSLGRVALSHGEAASSFYLNQNRENHQNADKFILNGFIDNGFETCDFVKPVICQWPSFEKTTTFDRNELDSHYAFLVIPPSSFIGKTGVRTVYLWVGRLYHQNEIDTHSDDNKKSGGCAKIEFALVKSDVLSTMGLPKDVKIEIVEENEEPVEFLSLLSSMRHS